MLVHLWHYYALVVASNVLYNLYEKHEFNITSTWLAVITARFGDKGWNNVRWLFLSCFICIGSDKGQVYSVEADGSVTEKLTNVAPAQAIAFSPFYSTFYYVDAGNSKLMKHAYQLDSGNIGKWSAYNRNDKKTLLRWFLRRFRNQCRSCFRFQSQRLK